MPQDIGSPLSQQREKLLFFVMLRQLEEPSTSIREAYQRLADTAVDAVGLDLRTVILDWLEGELRALKAAGEHQGTAGVQLMRAAVALSQALKQ